MPTPCPHPPPSMVIESLELARAPTGNQGHDESFFFHSFTTDLWGSLDHCGLGLFTYAPISLQSWVSSKEHWVYD